MWNVEEMDQIEETQILKTATSWCPNSGLLSSTNPGIFQHSMAPNLQINLYMYDQSDDSRTAIGFFKAHHTAHAP